MTDVIIYGQGFIFTSACAPANLTADEVAAAVNAKSPTGISSAWLVSENPTFNGGESNPCPCNTDETRQHWLLNC